MLYLVIVDLRNIIDFGTEKKVTAVTYTLKCESGFGIE